MNTLVHKKRIYYSWIVFWMIVLTSGYFPQNNPDSTKTFNKTEFMITMRDGVKLYTQILAPQNFIEPLPILLYRSPYRMTKHAEIFLGGAFKPLVKDGYIFVFQDIRGTGKSEGKFVMLRPARDKSKPKTIDESSDSYDTIEWLIKNVQKNNGYIGIFGTSYDAWLSVMASIDPHPALKAVVEEATPADMFLGDDFHHNGAFRLSYGFEYAYMMEDTSHVGITFPFDIYDTYQWYLKMGELSNVNKKYFHEKLPTWNDFVAHPNYDSFWQKQSLASQLNQITIPTLHVAGWWDQEDFYGPLKAYELLEKTDKNNLNFLLVGPWSHGGWRSGTGHNLGKIEFGDSTSIFYKEKILPSWFSQFLKGEKKYDFPEVLSFQTGSNSWKSYNKWNSMPTTNSQKLYFQSGGQLSFNPPSQLSDDGFDKYISDPDHPVPYRPRPIESSYSNESRWGIWLVEDQRFVHLRPDVLSWETETLKENIVITGDITAHLFASTTGTDSDWIVKLIDVYPEVDTVDASMGGYQLMIANEVFRGRFLKSFEIPEPIVPNKVNEYVIDLHSSNHCFKKGHKIMVQVQSSWFPIIDRNPQKFVENIFKAEPADFQLATQRIYRSKEFPSHISLPVQ